MLQNHQLPEETEPLEVGKLAKRLRELRGEKSLYLMQQSTNIHRINLSRYEKGLCIPSEPVLKKLAHFYGIDYADLRMLYYDDLFQSQEEKEIVYRWTQEIFRPESASPDPAESKPLP